MLDLPDTKRDSAPALREVASSETIRTSRQGDETLTFAMAARLEKEALAEEECRKPITANTSAVDEGSKLDLRVFDVMYALEKSAWRPSSSLSQTGLSVDGSDYRRHRVRWDFGFPTENLLIIPVARHLCNVFGLYHFSTFELIEVVCQRPSTRDYRYRWHWR